MIVLGYQFLWLSSKSLGGFHTDDLERNTALGSLTTKNRLTRLHLRTLPTEKRKATSRVKSGLSEAGSPS